MSKGSGEVFYIENIFVENEDRGKGIGKFILKMLLNKAFQELNCSRVELENRTQSNQFNPTKIPNQMYEKSGFEYSNPTHLYYKDDMFLTRIKYLSDTQIHKYLNIKN